MNHAYSWIKKWEDNADSEWDRKEDEWNENKDALGEKFQEKNKRRLKDGGEAGGVLLFST